MTRDRLLRERPVPDLNRCVESLRASEISKVHQRQMLEVSTKSEMESQDTTVDYVRSKRETPVKKSKHQRGPQTEQQAQTCRWCGESPSHPRKECRARKSTCSYCKILGHFTSVCRMRLNQVHEVEEELEDIDIPFLGEIDAGTTPLDFWTAEIVVNGNCNLPLSSWTAVQKPLYLMRILTGSKAYHYNPLSDGSVDQAEFP